MALDVGERPLAATQYHLTVGTIGAGSGNIFNQNMGTNTCSSTIGGLPASGTLFVRLWGLVSGSWQLRDYTFSKSPKSKSRKRSRTDGDAVWRSKGSVHPRSLPVSRLALGLADYAWVTLPVSALAVRHRQIFRDPMSAPLVNEETQ